MRWRLVGSLSLACVAAHAHVGDDERVEILAIRVAQHPGDASLLRERAALLRRAGRNDDALDELARAGAVGPEPREHLVERALAEQASSPARALDDLSNFLATGAPTKAALVARADVFAATGNTNAALDDYEAAFALSPDPDVAVALARACVASRSLDRAVVAHDAAVVALGSAPAVTRIVADALLAAGDAVRARAVTERSLALHDEPSLRLVHASALDALGLGRDAKRERTEVLASVDRALAKRDAGLTRVLRAEALAALGRGAEARREAQRVAKLHPDLTAATDLLTRLREN